MGRGRAGGLDTLSRGARDELFGLFPELAANPAAFGVTARRAFRAYEARLLVA